MRIAGKVIGGTVAFFVGAMTFLAPAGITGGGEDARVIPVDIASAEPDADQMQAQEKLDAAARAAFSKIDDLVTGSLPRDAAAAEAANPMTTRFPDVRDNTGFPSIGIAKPGEAVAPVAENAPRRDVETVGSIPPREAVPEPSGDVTSSVGRPAAAMPAPRKAEPAVVARPPARPVRAERPRRAQSAKRFRDRGPIAKVFRIFVMGIGFLPSRF